MIRSVVGFDALLGPTFKEQALGSFLKAVERTTGFEFTTDRSKLMFEDASIQNLAPIAKRLKQAGILLEVVPVMGRFPDEPPLFTWHSRFGTDDWAGGSSSLNEHDALIAAMAEGLERYIWKYTDDYFVDPITVTEAGMHEPHVALKRFAGFSSAQRSKDKVLRITPESKFLWIKAHSLVSGSEVYLPAQTITGRHTRSWGPGEALIRPPITTGLATGVTKTDALLGGILEVIERDALMITWLNQLTPPRVDLAALAREDDRIAKLLAQVERYRFSVEVFSMITDAPAHAVGAFVDDRSGVGVPRTLGMACDTRLADAIAHAISESFRMRHSARHQMRTHDAKSVVARDIIYAERLLYWSYGERYRALDFMIKGAVQKNVAAPWEKDSPEEHLARLAAWARERGYEIASTDLGRSKKNPTELAIEMVVIPELQPLHLVEKHPCIGGKRLSEVPRRLGYKPRNQPYAAEPQPFV